MITLFSCDKEDDSSLLFLEGSYESIMLSDSDEPIFTSVMNFNKSGKVLIEDFYYGINSGEACLVSFREETYLLIGEDFDVAVTSSFSQKLETFYIN